MPKYTEKTLEKAIAAVRAGSSLRRASKDYAIPLSTLHDRVHGRLSSRVANAHRQRLGPEEEAFLAKWILEQAGLGLPPTSAEIRKVVAGVLADTGDPRPLGKHWLEGFERRHPDIAALKMSK